MAEDVAGAVRRTPNPRRDDHAEIAIAAGCAGAGAAQVAPEGQDTDPGSSNRERLAELIRAGNPRHRLTEAEETALAAAILAAGWRPPLPDAGDRLNDLLGIDAVEKIYTQADLIDACSRVMSREREGQTVVWGYRRAGEPDGLIRKASAMEAQAAVQREGLEAVYRLVKPWKVDH